MERPLISKATSHVYAVSGKRPLSSKSMNSQISLRSDGRGTPTSGKGYASLNQQFRRKSEREI